MNVLLGLIYPEEPLRRARIDEAPIRATAGLLLQEFVDLHPHLLQVGQRVHVDRAQRDGRLRQQVLIVVVLLVVDHVDAVQHQLEVFEGGLRRRELGSLAFGQHGRLVQEGEGDYGGRQLACLTVHLHGDGLRGDYPRRSTLGDAGAVATRLEQGLQRSWKFGEIKNFCSAALIQTYKQVSWKRICFKEHNNSVMISVRSNKLNYNVC